MGLLNLTGQATPYNRKPNWGVWEIWRPCCSVNLTLWVSPGADLCAGETQPKVSPPLLEKLWPIAIEIYCWRNTSLMWVNLDELQICRNIGNMSAVWSWHTYFPGSRDLVTWVRDLVSGDLGEVKPMRRFPAWESFAGCYRNLLGVLDKMYQAYILVFKINHWN